MNPNGMKLRLLLIILVASLLIGCGKSVVGRYSHDSFPGQRLNFMKNGKVLFEFTGDTLDYSLDGDTVQITSIFGGAVGHVEGKKITFSGSGMVAGDLRGSWTRVP